MAREKFINGTTNFETWRDTRNDNSKYIARMYVINAMRGKAELTTADEIALVNTIMVSEMTGKLTGFYSISTSVLMNDRCQARAKNPDTICARCYAAASLNNYDGLMEATETNHYILNEFLISSDAWQVLAVPTTNGFFRIEAFGDVASVTCCRNYIRIIRTHSFIRFGVWTKNPDLWIKAFELESGKPENMSFIVSSIFVNQRADVPETYAKYVDHVFTVFNNKEIKEKKININCGSRDCNGCRNCYAADSNEYDIREKLK